MNEEFIPNQNYSLINSTVTDENFVDVAIDSFRISQGQIDAQLTFIDYMIAHGSNIIEYLSTRPTDDRNTFLNEDEKEKVVTAMGKYPQVHRIVIQRDFVDSELFGTLQLYDSRREEHLAGINKRRESIVDFLIYMNKLEIFTNFEPYKFPELYEMLRSIEPETFIKSVHKYAEEGLRFKRIIERHWPRKTYTPAIKGGAIDEEEEQ